MHYYDIICLSETWLKPEIPDSMVKLPDYNLFRIDRLGKIGGGVGAYFHKTIQGKVLFNSTPLYSAKPEFIFFDVSGFNAAKLLLCVIYRPPKCGLFADFESVFSRFYPTYKNVVIIGDFNVDMHRSYYEMLSDPTHHNERSHTLIDLCFVDDLEKVVDNSQYSVPFLSAHDLIHITYNFSSSQRTLTPINSRDIKHFDKSLYQQDLFSAVFASNSMECKLKAFNSNLIARTFTYLLPQKTSGPLAYGGHPKTH
ncbi:hypothetical protein J437_LFUL015856 [Ladona fulva]|uniref:Endonuclease/exonuclease/phosphatase domain-containing protein n=1 Tax=Ladona fulva TaxID=123851 RepID=A0A8K0KIV6_LADFU|nr:hypothetical protein J437_LFUL015856 [Ladona fulva]